jgi:hypothetical protein
LVCVVSTSPIRAIRSMSRGEMTLTWLTTQRRPFKRNLLVDLLVEIEHAETAAARRLRPRGCRSGRIPAAIP